MKKILRKLYRFIKKHETGIYRVLLALLVIFALLSRFVSYRVILLSGLLILLIVWLLDALMRCGINHQWYRDDE